jgi:hypothetical protein
MCVPTPESPTPYFIRAPELGPRAGPKEKGCCSAGRMLARTRTLVDRASRALLLKRTLGSAVHAVPEPRVTKLLINGKVQ